MENDSDGHAHAQQASGDEEIEMCISFTTLENTPEQTPSYTRTDIFRRLQEPETLER